MGGTIAGAATAFSVALVVALCGVGSPSASGVSTDSAPPAYVPSEAVVVPASPAWLETDAAGVPTAPQVISRTDPGFGQVAARSGVGLQTFRYSTLEGNASTLDVYTPRKHVGRHGAHVRTVFFVHGGAWRAGTPVDLEPQAVQLVKKLGVVVVSLTYRLATEAPWPAQREDVGAAIQFVRDNAALLNVDTKRSVIIGSSAGGQIAATVATLGSGKHRFRGLVTLSGLVNPLLMAERNPAYANAVVPIMLMRCLPSECLDRYRSAAALTSLDREDPPSLLFHSQDEQSWDPSQAREFVKASRAVGVPSKLVVLPGEAHGIGTWSKIWPILRPWLVERLGKSDHRY